jgi:hypothetical protein
MNRSTEPKTYLHGNPVPTRPGLIGVIGKFVSQSELEVKALIEEGRKPDGDGTVQGSR